MGMTKYDDPLLGTVTIKTLATAKRYVVRWKDDGLHITVPVGTTASEFKSTMESWRQKLLSKKPSDETKYFIGFKHETDDWSVEICGEPRIPAGYASTKLNHGNGIDRYAILVNPATDFDNPTTKRLMSGLLKKLAAYAAHDHLLPQARETANALGLGKRVKTFKIGRGIKRMGCCAASGEISLSCTLMFMPRSLRRATITHELAHLTHFDHSPSFYALWDKYLGHSHAIDVEARRRLKIPLLR